MKNKNLVFMLLFTTLFTLFTSCKRPTVTSTIPETPIVIDGHANDWENRIIYDEKLNVHYGVQNDQEKLYVALLFKEKWPQVQFMMNGLEVWLNDNQTSGKQVGIKFPRGSMEQGKMAPLTMKRLWNMDGALSEKQYNNFISQLFKDIQMLDYLNKSFSIYDEKQAAEYGIAFKLALEKDVLMYEMAIPLVGSKKHKWDYSGLTQIGVGFKTPDMEMRRGGPRMGGGAGMGGPAKAMDFWINVNMAQAE